MNKFITPRLALEINEYFIFSENEETIITTSKTENSDRILTLTFFYKMGTVYELKKSIGKPTLKVDYYHEGTSFIRDGSHTRRITQQDRELIIDLRSELEDFEYYQNDKELTKIDYEKISKYLEMIEKGNIAHYMLIMHLIRYETN